MNTDLIQPTLHLPLSTYDQRPASVPAQAAPEAAAAAASASVARAQDAAKRSQDVVAAAVDANRRLAENENSSQLTLEFDDQIGRVIYRLVDRQTGQLVRQIPPKEVLAIAEALSNERTRGVLLHGTA